MPETKTEVRVFKVERVCDKCGDGKMVQTGPALLTYPALHPHACEDCGKVEYYPQSYQWYSYEEIARRMT